MHDLLCRSSRLLVNCYYYNKSYNVIILSSKMAHSMTVTPCRNATALTSRSLVAAVNLATACRCSFLFIPSRCSTGAMCSRDGSHDSRISVRESDGGRFRTGVEVRGMPKKTEGTGEL